MDALKAFGLFAVSAMLIFYALEPRGRIYLCITPSLLRRLDSGATS